MSSITLIDYNNEKVVSSNQIAESLNLGIRSIDRLISKYTDKLELYGQVRFEITPQNKKVYYLNENQALFLGTLSKNTSLVVEFKQALVEAYSKARNTIPAKELTTLDILTQATKEIEKLQTQLTETQKTLEHKQDIIIDIASTVPPQTMRATVNRVVRDYARTKQCYFSYVWNNLYTEFKYIYNIDLKTRAKHQNKSPIQVAEDLGELTNFYKLSLKMFEI